MKLSKIPVIGNLFEDSVLNAPTGDDRASLRQNCIDDMKERFEWTDKTVSFVEEKILRPLYGHNWDKSQEEDFDEVDDVNIDTLRDRVNNPFHKLALDNLKITDTEKFVEEIDIYRKNIQGGNRLRLAQESGNILPPGIL